MNKYSAVLSGAQYAIHNNFNGDVFPRPDYTEAQILNVVDWLNEREGGYREEVDPVVIQSNIQPLALPIKRIPSPSLELWEFMANTRLLNGELALDYYRRVMK